MSEALLGIAPFIVIVVLALAFLRWVTRKPE